MTERKSSISELNSSDTKQTSTTQKPPNPRKCHSNYESKAAAELDEDIVLSTLDSTPSTLSVNAIQSKFPDHISDEHLRQHFSKYEKYILHAVILRSRRAKYGLITFSSYDIAETARKAFRNKRLLGCLTRLNHFGPTNNATPRDQMPSKVASFVPSMTDSQAPASVCIDKQSDTKILHQASEIGPAVSSGDPPTGNNTLCVEGIHSNLPDEIGDEELMKHFSAFGNDIISASIVRNPQTKLSAGYGVITFKSPAIAKKAQKKYNGTHLCRKYQLRVTLKNPTFSTRSVILVAKGDEGIGPGVLNSSNDRGVLESNPSPNLTVDDAFPAFTMKQESQKANGCNTNNSSFASEADVSDSIDIKSLKKEENSCSNTEGLVIENLSCIIDESEIKALISNCGAEVLSCTILPNPVAVNTCVANVSLADSSLAGNIIKQLNDKEVYGCRLQVRFAEMKHREPLLHVEERKVSLALFNFIAKQSCLQIKTFEQKGCAFYYQETKGCAVLSAPGENIATEFLLQVFNKYTEKTIVFKPNKWEQLTIVRDKHTPSLLNRAGSKVCAEADAQIIPQIDQHEILFVGTHEGVTRTSSWLMDELNREIQIESDKMEVLIAIYPTLDSDLADRYHIKVLNYSKESTIIEFEGDAKNVQKARQEIETLISKFCVTEVSFEHPPLLLDSAKKRIKENGFKVNIKTPVVVSRSNPICLTVSSFCPKQLGRAIASLKGHPTYKSFRIPNDLNIDSPELKRIRSGICKECQVIIRPRNKQKTCTSLTICGFVKNDVIDAHNKLQEQLFSDGEAEVSAKHKPTPKDVKKRDVSSSARLPASAMEHHMLKPDIKTSSKHCISVRKQFYPESCCRAFVTLSTEMTYYVQNRADWFKEITKTCISVKIPPKTNLTSGNSPSSGHVYTFEGKTVVIDKVIGEIHSLAQMFCVKVVDLCLPTENIRLMQSRWKQFKETSEAVHNVCTDFTIVSPNLQVTSKGESIVSFTICGNDSERLNEVVQHLQTKENGLNLPVQESKLSADQLMVLNSLIAKQQLNFEKHGVIMRIIPETRCLILKAASKQSLDQAYRDILTFFESSMSSHAKEVVSLEYETNEHSQSLPSSQPTSIKRYSLLFEPHYIPLFLSQGFVEIASQFEKAHGVRVVPISEDLINSTVKQVIYKSSSGHLITVQLCYGNLVYERVDAIVNYSRKLPDSMKSIGGEALQLELDNHIAFHQVEADSDICACLESGNLPCSKIIHVVSPLQDKTGLSNFSYIQRALECAQKHKLRQISFPFVSADVISAENFVYYLQRFFVQNPKSCVCVVRIVCSSEKLVNVCSGIKKFHGKGAILDLPKLTTIKPPLIISTEQTECQWYWQADDGTFIPYSKDVNDILVLDHRRCATGRCYFQVGSRSYIANFERMEQSNMSTRFIRKMKVEHIIQKKLSDTCHGKPGLKVSVNWFHHDQDKKCFPYSACDSASIEKLYFSSTESPTLQVNSEKFLYDFKAMQKLAIQRALPYDEICIQRKVVVQQLAKSDTQSSPQWYYKDDTKQFSPYSKHDSADIEGMYKKGAARTLTIQSKVYTFDFNDMNQINVATGYKRSIKRMLKSSVDSHGQNHLVPLHHICKGIVIDLEGPSVGLQKISAEFKVQVDSMVHTNELPLPVSITSSVDFKARILRVADKYNVQCEIISKAMDIDSKVLKISGAESILGKAIKEVMEEIVSCNPSSTATAIETPPEWQPQTKNTELFELSKSSNEYLHVVSMFHSTMSRASTAILSIKRIQNNWLWEKYVVTKNRMNRKNNGKINEKELFHGSRMCRAHNIYDSEEGFDMRYSSEGMWGQANYFAEKASYSNAYAYELSDGCREILLAKVLTGDSCKCASDKRLRLPPLKGSQIRFQQERYDTVEGETGGSKVFMTYSNDKAYPAYLIVYNPNSETAWRSSSKPTAAAQASASVASWSYNLNPTSSTQPSSTSVKAATPPSMSPSPSYQRRSHRPHNIPPQQTPKVNRQPQSDHKGCILQ